MLPLRMLLVVAMCCLGAARAAADGGKLALLPLDAPGKLSIYGQPVAAEIARSLTAAGLDVVVVGAQMAVPREAVLVIEGSLSGARKRVKIELRLRTLDSRAPLATVASSESSLETLDRAAGEVDTALLPQVQAELDKRAPAPRVPAAPERGTPAPPTPEQVTATARPTALVAVAAGAVSPDLRPFFVERLMAAVAGGLADRWDVKQVALPEISPASMMGVSATMPSALSLAFDVRGLELAQEAVFVGAVRARAVVTLGGRIVFDRTVTTDTVVGGRKGTVEAMLDLLAREVVTILRPRYARFLAATAPGAAPSGSDATHAAR